MTGKFSWPVMISFYKDSSSVKWNNDHKACDWISSYFILTIFRQKGSKSCISTYGGILGLVRFDINHMVHLTSSLEIFYLDKISVIILTIPFWIRLALT